jgi:hypothetical protein
MGARERVSELINKHRSEREDQAAEMLCPPNNPPTQTRPTTHSF